MPSPINPTASDVILTSPTVTDGTGRKQAGEEITAGQWVYQHTDGKLYKADNTTEAKATVVGMALNHAYTDQPCVYNIENEVQLGSVLTAGEWYMISATAGQMGPVTDFTSSEWGCVLGYAKSATNFQPIIAGAGPKVADVAHA